MPKAPNAGSRTGSPVGRRVRYDPNVLFKPEARTIERAGEHYERILANLQGLNSAAEILIKMKKAAK